MLTAGDIQFEPPQTKIFVLTTSIVALIAGDAAVQSEIMKSVQAEVITRVKQDPSNWLNVRDVAEIYAEYYAKARNKRTESQTLKPLGLTTDTFITMQRNLAPQLVTQLAAELINFDMPSVATIFAGVDSTGAHIYVANGSQVTCHDSEGFAAVGSGSWHASSQMMFAGHTPFKPLPETLLLVYLAKRHAEVAPGVGEGTDMFLTGPALGSLVKIGDHVLAKLADIYLERLSATNQATQRAEQDIKEYVEDIVAATTSKEQKAAPENREGNQAVDQKVASSRTEAKPESSG